MGFYVFGAGGHAKVVVDALTLLEIEVDALIDPGKAGGQGLAGIPVIADEIDVEGRHNFIVAIGDNRLRQAVYERALARAWSPRSVIHPCAVVAPTAAITEGTLVCAGAVVNADAKIGTNVIVNTSAVVEHDCAVGAHAHIAPRSVLGGTCTVGEGVLLGIGSAVVPGIKLGDWCTVGAGSVVLKNIEPSVVAYGNPCQPKDSAAVSG